MNEWILVFPYEKGDVVARFTERGLRQLDLGPVVSPPENGDGCPQSVRAWMKTFRRQLERYFAGKPEDFSGIPLDLDGATAFRRSVWETARGVPWGVASSYGDLARRMGRAKGSSRAVGQALGSNPIAIVIPCHRFLASDGSLGGFSCGLPWKEELLRLEGIRTI